jgi:hypothetical protein
MTLWAMCTHRLPITATFVHIVDIIGYRARYQMRRIATWAIVASMSNDIRPSIMDKKENNPMRVTCLSNAGNIYLTIAVFIAPALPMPANLC